MRIPISLARVMPFLHWPRPTLHSLRKDAWAGISVGLVLIPQAVAYAQLAGMPAETGLYAALLPGVVGILWGSSGLLAVGPVALTSLLTFGSLAPLAEPGTMAWVGLAIWLSLYAGVIQFALGLFRFGRIANLVSQPVMVGFVNAAAVIIIFSQLPALLGMAGLSPESLSDAARRLQEGPLQALMPAAFGGASLLLLMGAKRYFPAIPGVLLVTVLGIAASMLFDYAGQGGSVVGAIAAGMPRLVLPPAIPLASHQELWPAALVLALISFTEAMSSCRVLARKRNEQWDENQELIGQGLAKVVSGASGAFPVSGSFSRSALNLYAGATSGWATLFTSLCVLLSLLFLTDLIRYLPKPVLAAMVMVPVFSLLDFSAMRRVLAISRLDGVIAMVTFAVTLFSVPRLHWGVVAGVGLTMAAFLYRRTQPRIVEVGRHGDGTLRDRARFGLAPLAQDVLAVRLDAALNFLTASALERFINERCRANPHIRRVLLCCSGINDIDVTGIDTLELLRANLNGAGIALYLSAVKKQVWDMLETARFSDALGREHCFATDAAAMAMFSEKPA
jgi:sulfate permease, SulP family